MCIDLDISADHPSNVKQIGTFAVGKAFSKMGQQFIVDDWTLDIHQIVNMVNAFYFPDLNEFIVAAGFLQDSNYDYFRPMYLNFGSIGWVVGHEIIHGFDSRGRNFDKNGK